MAITIPTIKESSEDLVRKTGPGRKADPNPYDDFFATITPEKTYDFVVTNAEHKVHVSKMRAAANKAGHGLAVHISEPNGKDMVKIRFKTQTKRQVKPKTETASA